MVLQHGQLECVHHDAWHILVNEHNDHFMKTVSSMTDEAKSVVGNQPSMYAVK